MSQAIAINEKVQQLLSEIIKLNKLQESFIKRSLELMNEEEMLAFSTYIDFLSTAEHLDIAYMAKCYDTIVKDIFREQVYFMRHKKYRYSKYEEVSNSVYLNDEYMKLYMYGLAISTFLWAQHISMKRWFNERIPKNKKGQYLEVGPGHGYYFMEAQKKTSFSFFTGIDISPASIWMTKEILESNYFGTFKNYELVLGDFLTMDSSKKYDSIIMAEVLEHVEQPELFLQKLKSLANDAAFIYVTTVINAPAIDHLTLFTNIEEVEQCVQRGGLKIKDKIVVGSNNKLSVEENLKQMQPLNIAMMLKS